MTSAGLEHPVDDLPFHVGSNTRERGEHDCVVAGLIFLCDVAHTRVHDEADDVHVAVRQGIAQSRVALVTYINNYHNYFCYLLQ